MKNKLGQYFTTDTNLKEKLGSFILNNPEVILEPCIGRGDLVVYINSISPSVSFDMYEIDWSINVSESICKDKVKYCDFLSEIIHVKYKTIVGNPPYVKTKTGNLYLDFIIKCYNLLEVGGELIFIVPSDFFRLTRTVSLLNTMLCNGSFTHIYHPHNEKLFENASIDVLIFRYCKDKNLEKVTTYNDIKKYLINNNGFITFEETLSNNSVLFSDIFDIYVGIVSGMDHIFRNNDLGNIDVIISENQVVKFIYIEEFPSSDENINNYLLLNKSRLLQRRIKKFDESNWFDWGAMRNKKVVEDNKNKKCIYTCNLTRKQNISFLGDINYFSGGLLMLKPKKEINLLKVVEFMNSDTFKQNFLFSGRIKIGQRQLCNSSLPKKVIEYL